MSLNTRYLWPLHFSLLITNWLPDNVIFLRFRGWLASCFIGGCGKNLRIGRNTTFYSPHNLFIGDDVYIAYGTWVGASEKIIIEDEVMIGPYCVITASNHSKENGSFRYGKPINVQPIKVGRGSWIGSHCCILSGGSTGSGVLIAANSTLVTNAESNFMYAGSPAKKIKSC